MYEYYNVCTSCNVVVVCVESVFIYVKCIVAMTMVKVCSPSSSNHIHILPPTHMQMYTLMKGTLTTVI